jgi:hypothetical protein
VRTSQQGTLRGALGTLGRKGTGAVVVVAGSLPDAEREGLGGAVALGRHTLTLVAATGGLTTPGGRGGGDVVALDATEPFATAWNRVMVARRMQ